jgi:hypothetical protein
MNKIKKIIHFINLFIHFLHCILQFKTRRLAVRLAVDRADMQIIQR